MIGDILDELKKKFDDLRSRPHTFYRLDGTLAATITRDELARCVGGLCDLEAHVAENRLIPGEVLPVNAVALWAMQEAFVSLMHDRELLAEERTDLDVDDIAFDGSSPARDFVSAHLRVWVHDDCVYPDWGAGGPDWVQEWDLDLPRWWRHPMLAAELVAHAAEIKSELEAILEGKKSGRSHDMPERHSPGPVERRARGLVHLYLVDVVALIASKLPQAKSAAV